MKSKRELLLEMTLRQALSMLRTNMTRLQIRQVLTDEMRRLKCWED